MKNKIENKGIIWAIPLYKLINLVPDLSYNTPPAQINKPLDTNPCAKPKAIPPSIPWIVLLNTPIKYTAACDTEL
jgi:hypothetical protein